MRPYTEILKTTPEMRNMADSFTPEEEAFIASRCGTLKDRELTEALARNFGKVFKLGTVRAKRQRMGLRKVRGRGKVEMDSVSARFLFRPKGVGMFLRAGGENPGRKPAG